LKQVVATQAVLAVITGYLAGCAAESTAPVDPVILAQAKTYIGKTFKVLINVQDLCPNPDFLINRGIIVSWSQIMASQQLLTL
jgi:hypothetical protein